MENAIRAQPPRALPDGWVDDARKSVDDARKSDEDARRILQYSLAQRDATAGQLFVVP